MNVLSSGPVTPAKSPPRPITAQTRYGIRAVTNLILRPDIDCGHVALRIESLDLISETAAVFVGRDEGLDHLRLDEVAVELVELREPELKTVGIRIAPQVAEVLHRDERLVEYFAIELRVFNNFAQYTRARRTANRKRAVVEAVD